MLIEILLFIVTGIFAGVLGALLGLGGGIITIPCLVVILHMAGFQEGHIMHYALGTSLAAMVFNTLSSSISHLRRKKVLLKIVYAMIPGTIIGSLLGGLLARILPGEALKIYFGVFETLFGIYFIFFLKRKKVTNENGNEDDIILPSYKALTGLSLLLSLVATSLGLGGGLFTVPLLALLGVKLNKAIATSSCISFVITLMGAISFIIFGIGKGGHEYSVGFIYVPAFITIAIVSFLFAPLGAKLAHEIDTKHLKKIFGGILIATGISMIL